MAPPTIITSGVPQPLMAEFGQPLTITVKVTGSPSPTVKWQIGRKRVKESSKFEIGNPHPNQHTLTIKKAGADLNEGVWVMASNDSGEDCCQIEVKVSIDTRTVSMSDIRLNEAQDGNLKNQRTSNSLREDKKKIKKTSSISSLQNVNINEQFNNEISINSAKEKNKSHLEEEQDDEPYKRRSKRNSTSKRNSKSSAQVPDVSGDPGEVRGKIRGSANASGIEITSGNIASRPPKGKVQQPSPKKAAKEKILETDFDSINVEEKEPSGTTEVVKLNTTDDEDRNNSDVKIVIINNDDEDDNEDEDEADSDDNQENKELNGHCDNEVQAEFDDTVDKLWFINSINIIEFCRDALTGFSLQDLREDEAVQKMETDESQKKFQDAEINGAINEAHSPERNDKVPDEENKSQDWKLNNEASESRFKTDLANNYDRQDISKRLNNETSESSIKTDLANNCDKNEKIDGNKTVEIPKNTPLDRTNAKAELDTKKSEMNDKPQSNRSDKSDPNIGAKQTSNQNPIDRTPIKNDTFNVADIGNTDTYSKYRPPSRSSFKLSQTDNVPIPNKPPMHSTLGRPPPPPGTIENKPLTLTAYVVHKRSPGDVGSRGNGHAQNTPRRQKRVDKTRCRSADPLGRDEETNQGETEFDNNKDISSDSINWDRFSCTLPHKWSCSSSVLSKSGLVPTRSEEYLVIRRSDGKIKSLNNSRDNIFRSFQSLDKLNDSEAGSTGSKISRVGLNKKHQIITTTTTTEETYIVPKIEDKTDGNKQQKSVRDLKDANEKLNESKIPARIEKKQNPSVAEKGVGPTTNISLKDTGVGPEKTDKISKNVGVGTDPLKETKPDKPKLSSTMAGQQTDFVIVQTPSKHFDGSTQTGSGDQNKITIPASVRENPVTVTFTPVTPEEEKPKEPDLFVSQVNSFEFCEVNTFYIESDEGSNDQQARREPKHKGPSKGIPPPAKNEKPFPEKISSNKVYVPKPKLSYQNPTDDVPNPYMKSYVDEHSSKSPIPPISPHHFDVHAEVTPSNKFDAIFSPDNHRFARQYHDDIPGQKYVINYSDGMTAPRDLNYIDLISKNKARQGKPSKIPRSSNHSDKDVSSKKRDRSCERVVEISEKSRAYMSAETGSISQETTRGYPKSPSDEIDGPLSDETSETSSPRKPDTRRSRIAMSYHGPSSPLFGKD